MRAIGLFLVFVFLMVLQSMFVVEQFAATSPGTLIQLQTSRAGVFGVVDSGDWVPANVVAMVRPGFGYNTYPVY